MKKRGGRGGGEPSGRAVAVALLTRYHPRHSTPPPPISATPPQFHELLHAYTDSCYRWTYDIPTDGTVCYTTQRLAADARAPQTALWDAATRAPAPASAWVEHAESLARYTRGTSGTTPEAAAVAAGHRMGIAGMARWLRDSGQAAEAERVVAGGANGLPSFLITVLGLYDVKPTRPLVALLSRRNKRLILNEPELVAVVRGLAGMPPGAPRVRVELASLETMTLYEQIRLFRRATVLAGIHGSGLINSIFMHSGAALLQLMPYKVQSGASFFAGPAESHGVAYFEWTNMVRANTVPHWHFLGADHANDREAFLECGSNCAGQDVYFSFSINQVRGVAGA